MRQYVSSLPPGDKPLLISVSTNKAHEACIINSFAGFGDDEKKWLNNYIQRHLKPLIDTLKSGSVSTLADMERLLSSTSGARTDAAEYSALLRELLSLPPNFPAEHIPIPRKLRDDLAAEMMDRLESHALKLKGKNGINCRFLREMPLQVRATRRDLT